jgi:hypothetical protein
VRCLLLLTLPDAILLPGVGVEALRACVVIVTGGRERGECCERIPG